MTSAGDVAPIVIGFILIALAAAFFVEACGERHPHVPVLRFA